jgi:signal transduction histidine kinase
MSTFFLRAFRLATWRETAYLLLGFGLSIVAFVVLVTGMSLGFGLLITLVGVPILVLTAVCARELAWVERRRAGLVLGAPLDGRYASLEAPSIWRKALAFARDEQIWKDIAWLAVLCVVGFAFGLAALVLWPMTLYCLSFPFWWSFVPHAALPDFGSTTVADTWGWAALFGAGGLVGLLLTPWLLAGLAQVQVRLARFFLAPGPGARVRQLERSRAAAVRTQEEERRRLERDLHDGVQARLVALALDLGMARDKLAGGDADAARGLLDEAHEEAKETLAELRELVRGVHPAILADRGLDAAVSALAARSPVPVSVDVEVERLPAALESAAYFVVAETLANVAKHSEATRADVRVRRLDGRVVVEIADDGRGGARIGAGSGLVGLEDRVRALDGTLRVASPAGGPTVVVAELPCAS